jgi:hypothetical protein
MNKNKVVNILSWIAGIFLIIIGLLIALGIMVFGIGLCICGVLLLPPATSRLRKLTKNKFKGFLKSGVISAILIVSFVVGVVNLPHSENAKTTSKNSDNQNSSSNSENSKDSEASTSKTKSLKNDEIVKLQDEFEVKKDQKQKDLERFINLKSDGENVCIQNQAANNLSVEFFKINQNQAQKSKATANFAELGRLTEDRKENIDQASYDWVIYYDITVESKKEKCIKFSDFVDSKKYEERLDTNKTTVKDFFLRGYFKDGFKDGNFEDKNTNVRLKFKYKVD